MIRKSVEFTSDMDLSAQAKPSRRRSCPLPAAGIRRGASQRVCPARTAVVQVGRGSVQDRIGSPGGGACNGRPQPRSRNNCFRLMEDEASGARGQALAGGPGFPHGARNATTHAERRAVVAAVDA